MSTEFQVSLSQVQAYKRCPQAWYYGSIEGIRPRINALPLTRGSIIHTYLEHYYRGLAQGMDAPTAHASGRDAVPAAYAEKIERYAATARMMGSYEIAQELAELLPFVDDIAQRYYVIRGQADAETYDILAVEQPLRARLGPDLISLSIADLVTQHRDTGQILLWEHKSTKNVPTHSYRLRDMQTVLYIAKLEKYGIPAQGVLWNYLRTVAPRTPVRTAKTNRFSTAAIDTTWDIFRQAVLDAGEAPNDYEEMQLKLAGRETTHFFPRYEILLHTRESARILLEDYRSTAREMAVRRTAWLAGLGKPTRSLSRECDRCDYAPLCTAVLTGEPTDYLLKQKYTTANERRQMGQGGAA